MNTLGFAKYAYLGDKNNFNQILRYLVSVTNIVETVKKGTNPADVLNKLVQENVIHSEQLLPMLSLILLGKLQLPLHSVNLKEDRNDFTKIIKTCTKWRNIELICVYQHPSIGVVLINPAKKEHWEAIQNLKKSELMTIYAYYKSHSKNMSEGAKTKIATQAIDIFVAMLEGRETKLSSEFESCAVTPLSPSQTSLRGEPSQKATRRPVPVATKPSQPETGLKPTGKITLTPKYSIVVTNELFHNGNVEAWKNIIESYQLAHPSSKVIVFHEGALIQDLNALFKWGKVKNAGLLFFQIRGVKVKNVSKLQKYLFEGASPRFEAFMKHDVNKALDLF